MLTKTRTTTRPKAGFYIQVGCPGCGGALELEQDFFVLACDHCGSVLRLQMPDVPPAYLVQSKLPRSEVRFRVDRFLKENGLPLTSSRFHVKRLLYPYWKVDAILLRLRNRIEKREVVTNEESGNASTYEERKTEVNLSPYVLTSAAGMKIESIPHTLGMRAEYVTMVPFSSENIECDFLPVTVPLDDVLKDLGSAVSHLGSLNAADFGANQTELFRPVPSLVYFPYLIAESYARQGGDRFLVDGLSGRVLHHGALSSSARPSRHTTAPILELGQLGVTFHRCDTCGEDLPSVQSFVYICGNCHEPSVLQRHPDLVPQIAVAAGGRRDDRLFPFWAMEIPGDVTLLRRMFGGLHDSAKLVIPAFRCANFEAIYRLTKRLSAALPRYNMSPTEAFDERFEPVTVGVAEAVMLAEVVIGRERMVRTGGGWQRAVTFNPRNITLLFAPFHAENYFYVDSVLRSVTFEKSLVD